MFEGGGLFQGGRDLRIYGMKAYSLILWLKVSLGKVLRKQLIYGFLCLSLCIVSKALIVRYSHQREIIAS